MLKMLFFFHKINKFIIRLINDKSIVVKMLYIPPSYDKTPLIIILLFIRV